MAAALRLFLLGTPSLWVDEVLTWYGIHRGAPLGLTQLLENIHGPVYAALLSGWVRLAGDSEWVMRLPSAVFGALVAPIMALLSSRFLGRETAGAAAWLAAGSPFLIWYSQEARNYSMLLLCVCAAALALEWLRSKVDARSLALYAASASAGVLSNFSFLMLAPVHLRQWLTPGPQRGARLRALALCCGVVILAAIPWLPRLSSEWDWSRLAPRRAAVEGETPLRGATTFHVAAVPYALHTFAVGYTFGPSIRELRKDASSRTLARHVPAIAATAAVFGALAAFGLFAVRRRRRLGDVLLWIGVPFLGVCYFALQNFKVFHPRYVAVALPAVLLVLAAALTDLPRFARRLAVAAIAALWAVSLYHLYFDPRYAKDDMRGACRIVIERARPGECVIAAGAEDPVIYYYSHRFGGTLPMNTFWLGYAADPERMDARLDELVSGSAGAWVLVSRSEDQDPAGAFSRRLEQRFPKAERFARAGVDVWHIVEEPALVPGS